MKHRFRFFGEATSSQEWKIDAADQSHINKVLKLGVGDEVEVCDGNGTWAIGNLILRGGNLFVEQTERHQAELPAPVVVLLGALKHGDFDDLVAPLTEVGVTEVRLFLQPGNEKTRINDKAIARWEKLCIAAIKQAKSPYKLNIKTYTTLTSAVADLPNEIGSRYFMEPNQKTLLKSESSLIEGVVLAIGSEKGLSEAEVAEMEKAGFLAASIGPHILRAKTAAVLAGGIGALLTHNSV